MRYVVKAAFATGRNRLWPTVGAWNEPSLRVLDEPGFQHHHETIDARGRPLIDLVRQAPAQPQGSRPETPRRSNV